MDRPNLSGVLQPQLPPGFRFTDWASGEFAAEAWADVYNAGFVDDWGFYPAPPGHLLALFALPGVLPELQHLVVDDTKRPVALLVTQLSHYIADKRRQPVGDIVSLTTIPAFRRKGLARALLARGLRRLKGAGALSASLITDQDNENDAKALYGEIRFKADLTIDVWSRSL
jgi:ribosomal protein S18 acetylase RimI-like enzyme